MIGLEYADPACEVGPRRRNFSPGRRWLACTGIGGGG